MPHLDWPLTFFTLLTQLVLGAFAVLWVTDLLARRLADPREQERLTAVGVWVLGPLMAAGLFASFLHLGKPQYAFRVLAHLDSSWLSREAVAMGIFFGLGALYALLWWRKREAFTLRAAYGTLLAVVGAMGFIAMTMLYLLPARPTWNLLSTPLEFLATVLLLGPLVVGAVFVTLLRLRPATGASDISGAAARPAWLLPFHLRSMVLTTLVGAALVLVAYAVKWFALGGSAEGQVAMTILRDEYGLLLAARVALFGLGAVALPLWLLARLRRSAGSLAPAGHVWAMLALVAVSELLGRALFYATAVPVLPAGGFF